MMKQITKVIVCILLFAFLVSCTAGTETSLPAVSSAMHETENSTAGIVSATDDITTETPSPDTKDRQDTRKQTEKTNQSNKPKETQSINIPNNKQNLTISLQIECKQAIDKGYDKKQEFINVIPADGVMFSGKLTFQKGDSILDALVRESKKDANNRLFSIRKRGDYLVSINGLSEFACGPASGWVYLVNGETPGGLSLAQYKLDGNEQVVLKYVC